MDKFDNTELEALNSLYEAILTLKDTEEMHKFFMDLCSQNELCSMLHRWQILLLINEGKSYEEIIETLAPSEEDASKANRRSSTRVSSTTISRVKACYNNPDGGYRTALSRLEDK
ncbi:MAG: YerC/YecD family TrpR-related protein [Saccharofermentans sp.]|nr:YerC/YecD family TrpR-related protein [Saccharofermentans sp.]